MRECSNQSTGGTGGIQPVISRPDEPEVTRVVPDDPKVIVQSGNHKAVPMLAGATRHDGMFYVNCERRIFNNFNIYEIK
jgi:carboxylesterase type B